MLSGIARGGSKNHEIHQNLRNPVSLIGRRTWTVDEIEVASTLNFSIVVECSLLNACEIIANACIS